MQSTLPYEALHVWLHWLMHTNTGAPEYLGLLPALEGRRIDA